MRLTKQWAVTAAVVGSLIAAMSPGPTATAASQAEACEASFRELSSLSSAGDFAGYLAEAVNRDGDVAGRVAGGGPLAIWRGDGTGSEYEIPWAEPQVFDMNEAGQVLGRGVPEDIGRREFWVFRLGDGVTPLTSSVPGTGDQRSGEPLTMNDRGSLAGRLGAPGATQAAYWAHWDKRPEILPLPSVYQQAEAWSISNRGVITGRAWAPDALGLSVPQEVIVRWREGTPTVVSSPTLSGNQSITHVAGRYFAGSSSSTLSGLAAYLGTAADFPAVDVLDIEEERITGLTRSGLATGYGWSESTNQFPIAFIASATDQTSDLNRDFQYINDPHDFGGTTALLASGGKWFVGSCLDSFLAESTG